MEKKLKRSPWSIAFYVIAAALLIHAVYTVFGTISYLNTYFSTYGSSIGANFGNAISYIFSNSLVHFIYAALAFTGAKTFDEVRKLNPDNYFSEDELAMMELAKQEKLEAKKAEAAAVNGVKEETAEAAAEEVSAEEAAPEQE